MAEIYKPIQAGTEFSEAEIISSLEDGFQDKIISQLLLPESVELTLEELENIFGIAYEHCQIYEWIDGNVGTRVFFFPGELDMDEDHEEDALMTDNRIIVQKWDEQEIRAQTLIYNYLFAFSANSDTNCELYTNSNDEAVLLFQGFHTTHYMARGIPTLAPVVFAWVFREQVWQPLPTDEYMELDVLDFTAEDYIRVLSDGLIIKCKVTYDDNTYPIGFMQLYDMALEGNSINIYAKTTGEKAASVTLKF